jgi:DNA topoisomerase VI subunit A
MNMSYDSSNLTTPDIKWLGVRPSDLDRFSIPEQCRLPMTDEDIKTGKKLVSGHSSIAEAGGCWCCSLKLSEQHESRQQSLVLKEISEGPHPHGL